jgi:hypothetical protein
MNNPRNKRWILIVLVAACLTAIGYWIKATRIAQFPSKSAVGKVDLARKGAVLQVRFVPPERLSSVTILLSNPVPGSDDHSGYPTFPLALRLRVSDESGTNIWDELVEQDRLQWTNWHPGPSLLLSVQSWLSQRGMTSKPYLLTLTVEKSVDGLGEAEVYLHWMDYAYLWGIKRQTLTIVTAR